MNSFKKFAITIGFVVLALSLIVIIYGLHFKTANEQNGGIYPPQNATPKHSHFCYSVYETDEQYVVTVSDEGVGVTYSKDRRCQNHFVIKPIKNIEMQKYLGNEFKALEKDLGKYHVDTGSGFFIPSYFTEDGYLMSFHVENDYITCVQTIDLFSGELIKRVD